MSVTGSLSLSGLLHLVRSLESICVAADGFPYSLFAVFAKIVKEIEVRNLRHLSLLLSSPCPYRGLC